jgi:hypothetical protein
MGDEKWFDLTSEPAGANAFIQWKGTDVCMDFTCECGAEGHIDGYFAHVVECPSCKELWEMPMMLFPRLSQRDPSHGGVVTFEPDDEAGSQQPDSEAQVGDSV